MGLVVTRYENAANQTVKFDLSKFDYFYTDEGVSGTDIASDFDTVLLEIGTVFNIYKQTVVKGSMGNVTSVTEVARSIYAYIEDITKRDREIHELGLAVSGNSKMFIKPTYSLVSAGVKTSYVVAEGDIFKDTNGHSWRIVKIVAERKLNDTVIFKIAVIQSVDLDGTE